MCSHSNSNIFNRLLTACFALILGATAFAQSATVAVTVTPPYTKALADYIAPGKVNAIVQLGTNVQPEQTSPPISWIYLQAKLTCAERGITIQTKPGSVPSEPIMISGRVNPAGITATYIYNPYTLTNTDIRNLLGEDKVSYSGITQQQVRQNGLPDGNYQLSIIVYHFLSYGTGPYEGEEYGRGTASFTLQSVLPAVNQTVQVLPPYTKILSDYASSAKINSVIQVTQHPDNTANLTVYGGIYSADGSIRIDTNSDFGTPAEVTITKTGSAFPPYVLTNADLRKIFNPQTMYYSGITKEQVARDGLPPGTYTVCFNVTCLYQQSSYDLGRFCSAPFTIQDVPPIVNQTVQVLPPYTKTLMDYFSAAKIRSTITIAQYPTDDAVLSLSGRIQKTDQSVTIASDSYARVSIKKTGAAFPPYTLTQADIVEMFKHPYATGGITMEELQRNGLPDGSYDLCITLHTPEGRELGTFCSPPFTVGGMGLGQDIEPPIIIQPYDGSELLPEQAQTLQFTWTRPAGAPAETQYKLRIVELRNPNSNYRDMLRSDNYPVFFETTVGSIPTYLYTVANPALNKDRYYAFVVQAFSPIGTAPVKFRNDGYSEPALFSFQEGKSVIPDVIPIRPRPRPEVAPLSKEGLAIFVPGCPDCNQGQNNFPVALPGTGTDWQLLGHTLDPNLSNSGPNVSASAASASVHIPADAVAVNNARNFFLRWEDKGKALAKLQPKEGEGIVYRLRVRDAANNRVVWEQDVWNNNSYEQTHRDLPFQDGRRYLLHIEAVRGMVAQGGFEMIQGASGKPQTIASSCECAFTFMKLPDVPDMEEYTVRGKLSYKFEHYPDKYPLTTTTATLTRYTKPVDGDGDNWLSTPKDDRHAVPVRINEDGSFEVTFHAYPDNGLIPVDPSIVHTKPLKLREFFVLELNSPYYRQRSSDRRPSPATIVNLTDKVIDLGEITYNVWSYALEVEVSKGYGDYRGDLLGSHRELTPQNVSGEVKRIVFGLDQFKDMPYYEGDIPASEPKSALRKTHVTDGKVEIRKGVDGKEHTYVTFDRLICNFQSNDRYLIDISQELEVDGKKKEYKASQIKEDGYQYRPGSKQMSTMLALPDRSHFVVKEKATLIDDRPPQSSVKGRLVFADPSVDRNRTQPLANTDIALVVTYLIQDDKGHSTVMDPHHLINEKNNGALVYVGGDLYNEINPLFQELSSGLDDRNRVLATTRTDADGNFEFKDFAHLDSLYTAQFKKSTRYGPSEFHFAFNLDGHLKRTVRVVVNNRDKRSWLNPNVDIDVQPNSSVDVRTLTAYLDTYKLRVKPVGDPVDKLTDPDKVGKILKDVFVNVRRDPMYQGEPEERTELEDYVKSENGPVFSVPRHQINQDGYLGVDENATANMFNELQIRAFTRDTVGEQACHSSHYGFPRDYYEWRKGHRGWSEELLNSSYSKVDPALFKSRSVPYLFVDDFKNVTYDLVIAMKPKEPVISGRVLDAENRARSVEKGKVLLKTAKMSYYLSYDYKNRVEFIPGWTEEREVSNTRGKGYFYFDKLIPNIFVPGVAIKEPVEVNDLKDALRGPGAYGLVQGSSDYQLSVKARGYTLAEFRQQGQDPVKNVGSKWFPAEPLKPKMGQQFHFPAILMGPDGWITGCVIDEEGYALEALVKTTRSVLKETEYAPPGKSCPAKVRGITVGGTPGSSKPTAPKGQSVSVIGDLANNWFKVPAPSTYSDTLFVMPRNISKYFSDTLLIPAMPEGEYDVGQVVLKERKHRIRIVVIPYTNVLTHVPPGIPGLTVRLDGGGEAITDENGVAEFKFVNNAKNFHYEIIPSDNSDYIARSGELTNADSKEMVTYYIMLKKGATVSGKVTTDGKPVPGAEVWVLNGNDKRLVKADADGRYTLRGIKPIRGTKTVTTPGGSGRAGRTRPRQVSLATYDATIHCAPPDNPEFNNLRGLDKEVSFLAEDGSSTVDFELEIFYKANIRSLHGFGITVTDIKEDGGDNYRITGTVRLDKAAGRFEIQERMDQNAQFKDLKVKAGSERDEQNRPYLVAVGGAYGIGLKQMDATLKAGGGHNYSVELGNDGDAFLKVTGDGVTGGFIRSKARIKPNSFSFTDVDLAFDENQFYLGDLVNGESTDGVTSFKRYLGKTETEEEARSFGLQDRKGGPMHFKFIAFEAVSPLKESRLGTDGVITLKPDVWFLNPLLKPVRNDTIRLNLPEIKMTPKEINRGGVNLKELAIDFEKWKVVAKNCVIDASRGGIVSKDVVLRTGSLDFPAKNFLLNKDQFLLDDFEVDKLPLGKDVATVDIDSGASFQFALLEKCGMDMGTHLMLSLVKDGGTSPVGRIKGLPGFGQDLVFQSITLISNGEQKFGFATNSEKIRFFDVVDFLPVIINSHEDSFNLDGTIDYGIPRIPSNINQKLTFTKGRRGKLDLTIGGSDIGFKNVGTFNSLMSRKEDRQLIVDGLAELHGTIHEPGHLEPLRVVVRKRRTAPGQYRIWMEREDPKKAQVIRLGGTAPGEPEFLVDKADMVILPETGDWDLLRLKLVPSGTYGEQSGLGTSPLYFQLIGDLYTDTSLDLKNQQIKMVGTDRDPESGNNMDGFMGFELVYDFPNQQFVGGMTISEKKVGGVKFSGDLHMVIGRPGFYFMGAGGFMLPSLGEIKGGMVFGYYNQQIPLDVWSRILAYSQRGEVPCAFTGNNFRGFYAMGAMATLPFIGKIEEGKDVAGYGYQLLLECGAEAAVWGSFQPKKNEIGVSAMLFANMKAKASVPLLTIGLGASASIKGYATMLFNSPYTATLGLCGELNVTGCFKAGIGAAAIGGELSVTAHAGIEASVNLSNPLGSPKAKGSFGWGSCGSAFGKANCPVVVKEEKLCD